MFVTRIPPSWKKNIVKFSKSICPDVEWNVSFIYYLKHCGNNAPFSVYDYDMDHLGIIRGPYIFHKMHEIETYS